jgi:hypothetical protein
MRAPTTTQRTASRALTALALVAVPALSAACALSPKKAENQTHRYPAFGLEDSQPADIAVVPIRDLSKEGGAPVGTLREQIYRGLVPLMYSPLDLDFVDVHWVEAGFAPEALEAGGVLQITIQDWDTSLLGTHGAIQVALSAEILDGRRPGAKPLWGVQLQRRLELAHEQVNLSGPALFDRAAELLAAELLLQIPVRNPKAR